MNLNFRLSHPGMWWGLALLIGPFFFGCSKQDFEEVEITETWTEPDTIYSVDCEELGLNLADSCTVDFGELGVASGVVTEECTCDAEINGEQITEKVERRRLNISREFGYSQYNPKSINGLQRVEITRPNRTPVP